MINFKKLIAITYMEREISKTEIEIHHLKDENKRLVELIARNILPNDPRLKRALAQSLRYNEKQASGKRRELEIQSTICAALV
jgi:hypothetical protein